MSKVCEGLILLQTEMKRVFLLQADETFIDFNDLKEGESVHPGSTLEFPCHKVIVGEQIQSDEKKSKCLKRKRLSENREREKELKRVRSPQATLLRSPMGLFARVASSRKGMPPQVKRSKSESPSMPNVTGHFPSPNLPWRRRPRKLKSHIWKDFVPVYEHGRIAQGRCKHCHEVFVASQSSGTNHVRRHLKTCLVRKNMHEMVGKLRASASSPQVTTLDSWNFSQEDSRRDLANMIVQHGLPFSIVEYSGFIKFVKGLNPMFKMVSRTTIKDDCMESYKEQREMLREMLKNCGARVSLTADMWTSNQRLGYLCVTCHFIDKTWKMQKRILRFCMMETPHSGFRMYNAMLKSLQYWNIEDKICSITLDNASVNGKMMEHLKENLTKKQMLTCGGELFHIRCAAHVLNLIVQDGLFVMKGSIDKIRESVKYIKSSQTREELFQDIVKQLGIVCEKEPSIDIATRWNSTYLMIDSALPYMEAFYELVEQDPQFKYAPSADDWNMAEAIRSLLKIFFKATQVVSGSSYPTANRYFHEIWSVKLLLEKHTKNKNQIIASMVSKMQKKFDKYWKESYLANCIPVILDPRYKLEFIEYRIKQAFGDNAEEHLKEVDTIIKSLFREYSNEMGETHVDPSEEEELQFDELEEVEDPLADWEAHLKVQKKQATSELDRYLSEELFPRQKDFDILGWWEMHSPKYPVLSCIARDVLAIQASTVASESSFSAGGRIISDHRTRLKSDTVEGLICLQDWLKAAGKFFYY
jgi:hypothetical protein